MFKFIEQIELIERLDQLIRLENTGNPEKLSIRLNISQAKLFRVIKLMKDMKANIYYNPIKQSYVYENETLFKCGFYTEELSKKTAKEVSGGSSNFNFFLKLADF